MDPRSTDGRIYKEEYHMYIAMYTQYIKGVGLVFLEMIFFNVFPL